MARRSLVLCAVIATCALALPAAAADAPGLTDEGLAPIKVKNVDKAWKRPGASLAGYDRILLRPVSVAFSKNWNPRDYGGPRGLRAEQVEKIRTSLGKLANEVFARELTRGGYAVAATAGENVLDVEAQIVDLVVNAPDDQQSMNVKTYVFSAGEMRILVTLRDSITGTTLYRASDLKRGADNGRLEYTSDVWNRVQAELALTGWARQLKTALDAAKVD